MSAMTTPLRVGLLGFSDIARRRFAPSLATCDSAALAAIGTNHPEAARVSHPGAAICGYGELLARPDVDLVYISLPNHLHEEWTIRALEAGKHVLCEKPLATSPDSVERMIAVASKSGRLLFENLMFLQHPQHALVSDLLAAGRIGTLRTLRSAFGFHLKDPSNFRFDPARGGGACADLLTYTVGTFEHFLGGELRDPAGCIVHKNGIDIAAHGVAHTGTGVVFSFSVSFCQQYESCYELVGDAGILRLDRAYTTPPEVANRLLIRSGSAEEYVTLPAADHFAETIRHVARLIAAGTGFDRIHAQALHRHQTIARIKSALRPTN